MIVVNRRWYQVNSRRDTNELHKIKELTNNIIYIITIIYPLGVCKKKKYDKEKNRESEFS